MSTNHDSRSQRFFSVDASWLHMDTPCNRVTIVGLALYDRPLRYERLRAAVENRLLHFARFRERVREGQRPLELPSWEPDPHFDLDAHLWRLELPAPGDWSVLQCLVEKVMQIPLPEHRPLWRMILVEHYGTGSAMVLCLSHALADGAAMLHVFNTFTGDTARASLARLAENVPVTEPVSPANQIVHTLDLLDGALQLPEALLDQGRAALADPLSTLLRGADLGLALGKLLFIPPDRRTPLSGSCGPAKRAVMSEPIPLDQAKTVGKAFGAKVNDVVLSAVTGSLRSYLSGRGQDVEGLNLRALVPVYLHPWEDEEDLRNGFGLVFLSLPVGVADPLRRLRVLKRRMDRIKGSPEASVAYGILHGMGYTPPAVERLIARGFGLKATAVMTNVMGPSEVRYLGGVPTSRMAFWVPQPAGLGIGVAIISYAGQLTVTLATDAKLVPDPEAIMAGFHDEFEQLLRLSAYVPRKKSGTATKRPTHSKRARQPA